jgi:uncharacterized membrane protein YidH (DUF202 family)
LLRTAAEIGYDVGLEGKAMKQKLPREIAPLWVWVALAMMVIGTIVYVSSYMMVEEIIAQG